MRPSQPPPADPELRPLVTLPHLKDVAACRRAREIKTGSRTILSYLLSPLLRYRHETLRER